MAATTNIPLTTSWTLIASQGEYFLASVVDHGVAEIALRATASLPDSSLRGHVLRPAHNEAIARPILGEGYVYARTLGSFNRTVLAITK